MYKLRYVLVFIIGSLIACQSGIKDAAIIKEILHKQQKAWNTGELESFMDGYWPSDSLKFIGSRGLAYGWQKTLDNYKKSYPDKATMGQLNFKIISLERLANDAFFMVGKWALDREEKEDVSGHFTLIWKKINGKWVIVADHSS